MWRIAPCCLVLFLVSGLAVPYPAHVAASSDSVPDDGPVVTGPRLAGWYPIYEPQGSVWRLQVDGARGRIITDAVYVIPNANGTGLILSYSVLVLDMFGNLLQNVTVSQDSNAQIAGLALDASTGAVYASLLNGTIVHVDPQTGQIVHWWTYWHRLSTIVAQAGEVFVSTCCDIGVVMRLSGSTGALVRNYTPEAQGSAISIAVDPGGRWLFVAMSEPLVGRFYRVDQATGLSVGWGDGNFVQLSADGRRVWMCGWGSLRWYWLANDSFSGSGVSCPDTPAENPASGVLALTTSGRFITEARVLGTFWPEGPGGEPAQATAVGWNANGTTLVAIAYAASGYVVGLWDGNPWLDSVDGLLLNPNRDHICYPLVTAGGLNETSVIEYRDGVELARGTLGMTEACFGTSTNPSIPLLDGPHVGRIVGFDRVGRPLDASVSFETDGTPPVVAITSPLLTTTSPYTVSGTADDPHLSSVHVRGVPTNTSGREWSATMALWIGNNTVSVQADDTVGNQGGTSVVVRYWPPFDNTIVNDPDRFRVSIPPGWTGLSDAQGGGVRFGAMLLAPPEGTYVYNTSATVESRWRPAIVESPAAAYAEAVEGMREVARYAVEPPRFLENTTVDGHPAARIWAIVGSNIIGVNTSRATLTQTYVVSATLGRVYVISFNVSWMQLDYRGVEEWILESFHAGPTVPVPPSPPGPPLTLVIVAAGGGAGGVGAVLLVWWIRRRRSGSLPPPREGGSARP